MCFQRSGGDPVPFCDGSDSSSNDYCTLPALNDIGNNLPSGSYDLCQGDCDSDADCKNNLHCFKRDGFAPVPGCDGLGTSNYDYCILPPPPPAPWQEIFFDDFESGTWNGWSDGGDDATLISNANNAHSGTYALRIQDDTASSTVTSSEIDTTSFSTIKVEFFFKPKRMTASTEAFHFDISTDGGSSFTAIKTWTNQDMSDNQWNQGIIDGIDVSSTDRLHVRFECEGSTNQDRVFIDDIKMEGK